MPREKMIKLPPGVLKVKKGYNPNSSSIGTLVYSFPLVFMALSTVLAACAVFIRKKPGKKNEE